MAASQKTVLVIDNSIRKILPTDSSEGANRGIGLTFIKTLKDRGWSTIGSIRPETCDDPSVEEVRTTRSLSATGSRIVQIDYKNEETIREAAAELKDVKLDMLINCAVIAVQPHPWQTHGKDDLMERFEVMTVGPFLAIKHFLPNILRNGGGKIVNISSSSGSIAGNDDERFVGYKMAKAALNQLSVTLANGFKSNGYPISIVAFQPGYIKTKRTSYEGTIDIKESVTGMVDLTETMTPEGSPYVLS
ncbi:hypothetical protein N0V83_005368 [Neocucurbitaria cava]|uniref:NAD(P)-binding protein n=1 Tax=Neocucurbitaria cava TaxID=798079 RepID=A0A9W8Y7T3_9PLEO|nr:hypothetical protein N0V83_005368 [Neocucurbitaria cava]